MMQSDSNGKSPRIAVLALQGAFIEHEQMLQRLGCEVFEVRQLSDWLQPKDALVIPGGESTVMLRLMEREGLFSPLRQAICEGLPVMGTCAGMIALASKVLGNKAADPAPLATMNITVERNAYGRQLDSFNSLGTIRDLQDPFPMTFIRAPRITETGENVEVLAEINGQPVAVRQGKQMAIAFHPELTTDTRLHKLFVSSI